MPPSRKARQITSVWQHGQGHPFSVGGYEHVDIFAVGHGDMSWIEARTPHCGVARSAARPLQSRDVSRAEAQRAGKGSATLF